MRSKPLFLIMAICLLAGCSGNQAQPAQKPDFARGGHVFDLYCAQCHMDDDNSAPQLDEPDDWEQRTHEWSSILQDHAKSGFLRMPAKGGQSSLSNQNIDDALYYMDVKIKALQ